jgi:hypothetical protein
MKQHITGCSTVTKLNYLYTIMSNIKKIILLIFFALFNEFVF